MGQMIDVHVLDSQILIYHINNQLDEQMERVILGFFDKPVIYR